MKTLFDSNDVLLSSFSANFDVANKTKALKSFLGFDFNHEVAKLAIGISLGQDKYPDIEASGGGTVIRGKQLFGDDDYPIWVGLLITNYYEHHSTNEDFSLSKLQNTIRIHWTNGINILYRIYESCDSDINKFWNILLRSYSTIPDLLNTNNQNTHQEETPVNYTSGAINIVLGSLVKSKEKQKFEHILNGANYAPHIAIMGQAGTGKTQLMKSILTQIRTQSNAPILIMDLGKGDLGADQGLLEITKAEVISVPDSAIPLDMFYVPDIRDDKLTTSAMLTFRDAFAQVAGSKFGAKQQDIIRQALLPLFQTKTSISFDEIRTTLENFYEENNLKTDSVISTVNDLTLQKLFEPKLSPSEFFNKNWIITFQNARTETKTFTVCLLLSALDFYMKSLPESNLDENKNRTIRLTVAIDEARALLNMNHEGLSSNMRLHRAKGLSIILVSQSPDDYDGKKDNYLENIGLPICLRTNATSSRVLKNMFHGDANLSDIKLGTCLTVNAIESKPVIVQMEYAQPFYFGAKKKQSSK